MNTKTILSLIVIAALAGAAGWYAGRNGAQHAPSVTAKAERRVMFYQSPMHPWIKSDKPGKCTICGMDLVPVYEGDPGISMEGGIVSLRPSSIQVIGLQTEPVKKVPLKRTLNVAGVIDDDDTRHRIVSAYVDGRIDKLLVNFIGAEIAGGQPLATLYSPPLLTAQQEYLALLERRDNATGQDRSFYDSLEKAARARLQRLGLADSQIASLKPGEPAAWQTDILAPMSGTVISRMAYEGQYVREGERLFEIGDFSKMWFVFDVYEKDLPWIRVGQDVTVRSEGDNSGPVTAKIDFINPNLDPMSRSAKVRVVLDNPVVSEGATPRRRFQHKLFADGLVKLDAPTVLAIPRRAVLNTGNETVVFVDRGEGAYERRPVRLGRTGDTHLEVLSGLDVGEAVVTEGNLILDGQAQLNLQASGSPAMTPDAMASDSPMPAPTMDSLEDLRVLVRTFAAASAALSSDDLPAYKAARPAMMTALETFLSDGIITGLDEVGALAAKLTDGPDIKAARRAFEPFSTALADWLKPVRDQNTDVLSFKIYQCPMTPVLGKGRWVQTEGPLSNPFFGSAMLRCGDEIR